MKQNKILLINPSMKKLYKNAKVKSSVPNYFPLNLLTIAKPLVEKKYEVKLLNLNFHINIKDALINCLKEFNPNFIGITFTTPLYSQSLEIISIVKEYNPNIIVVAGGVHITSDCLNTMENSKIDIAVIGEGDFKLLEIIESKDIKNIKGIAYKKENKIIVNEREPLLQDLDKLPFPAIELININNYKVPYTFCRENPVFPLETSRGCVFGCVYCNKSIFGRVFRVKSTKRIIEDIKKIINLGYKEVHIMDDGFTTDINRAKEICKEIIRENIKIKINCANGLRADCIDLELLNLMKQAGFYRTSIGVESGSQEILDNIKKDIKLEKISEAIRLCKKAGIETIAYFMFGLPGEKEINLKETIKFAKKLKPDIAKFDILIPLPSTPIFDEWKQKGYIISTNWNDYQFYSDKKIYEHPNLSQETLLKYLNLAYRSFYFSPNFIIKRFIKSLKQRTLLNDIKTFLSTKW